MRWKKVTLAGVGLLGGSLGLALKRRRLSGKVVGFVRRSKSIEECLTKGAVDSATLDLEGAVCGADLIVLCTPIAQMAPLLRRALPFIQPGAIITDVGSVKGSLVNELEKLATSAGAHFVGSHPMAGGEKMGVGAAQPDLFVNAVCTITSTAGTNRVALGRVEKLWKSVGSRILRLSPEEHDALVAQCSHLPHALAATLANLVLDPRLPRAQKLLCATGFRDTTRVASGSPEMWRDIAMSNRKNLGRALDTFAAELKILRTALKKGDAKRISNIFQTAKERRDRWVKTTNPASPV